MHSHHLKLNLSKSDLLFFPHSSSPSALCRKVLNMDHVMHIATKNYTFGTAFLEELNIECGDLPYHTEVRWTVVQLFSNLFGVDVNNAPEDVQMELIELQCNDTLKAKLNSVGAAVLALITSHGTTDPPARSVLSVFGSTYLCQQLFH
ncbi:GTD2A protein, partial [Amia calva]|nr:GTD2A protein [Amia calva]